MTITPFNFGRDIRKMSIDENEDNELEDTYTDATTNKKKIFQQSNKYSYEFMDMDHDIYRLRVKFFISKQRLEIIEKLLELKYHNSFQDFIEQAILELVEADINSPEGLVQDYCKRLRERWNLNPIHNKRRSLQSNVEDSYI